MNPFQNSGNDTSKSTSIVKWAGGVLGTGQILAHELAHGMGVKHDFETHRGRSWTCGPSRDEDGGCHYELWCAKRKCLEQMYQKRL